MNATLIRGEDGGLHVHHFDSIADSIAACAAFTSGERELIEARRQRIATEKKVRADWLTRHAHFQTLCPATPATSSGISGHFTAADSHQPKLARGIQF